MGTDPVNVSLQSIATSPGFGTIFTPADGKNTLYFEIIRTSTSRTIAFEIVGPRGEFVSITAYSTADPSVSG
jgi:hypothetical protein